MPNVWIEIMNSTGAPIPVQNWSHERVADLHVSETKSFAVVEESDVQVQYDASTAGLIVTLQYADSGSPVKQGPSQVTLNLYDDTPVHIKATQSLHLDLKRATDPTLSVVRGVKCGEIIIYPPS